MTAFLFTLGLAASLLAVTWLVVKKVQQARQIYFFHHEVEREVRTMSGTYQRCL